MSVKVGTLVNKKQEPLISNDFEKAAALYRERSYDALVASRDILKAQHTVWNWIIGICLGTCLLLSLIGLIGVVGIVSPEGAILPTGAADVWGVILLIGLYGLFPTIALISVSERNEHQLSLTNLALQLHDRKDEIIAVLTKQ